MRNMAESTINDLGIGATLDLDELIVAMLDVAPKAVGIGMNQPKKFEEVYVYRTSQNGSDIMRSRTVSDSVTPLYNERVLLETSTRYRGIQFITF